MGLTRYTIICEPMAGYCNRSKIIMDRDVHHCSKHPHPADVPHTCICYWTWS